MMLMAAFAHSLPGLLAQAQTSMPPPGADYMRILPELVLSIFGMLVMIVDPLLDEENSHQSLGTIALIGTLAALASTAWMAQYPGTAFWNMVRVEGFSVFFHFLVIAIAAVIILLALVCAAGAAVVAFRGKIFKSAGGGAPTNEIASGSVEQPAAARNPTPTRPAARWACAGPWPSSSAFSSRPPSSRAATRSCSSTWA